MNVYFEQSRTDEQVKKMWMQRQSQKLTDEEKFLMDMDHLVCMREIEPPRMFRHRHEGDITGSDLLFFEEYDTFKYLGGDKRF